MPGASPTLLRRARLPRWCLPSDWPQAGAQPACADLRLDGARLLALTPARAATAAEGGWDLAGAPVLPGLVDAHTHLDKTFTLGRVRATTPGLLGAIEAMGADRQTWTPADVRQRAGQGLRWAHEAGVVHLRTHVDWWEPGAPLAWGVLQELASEWAGRLHIERVSLMRLPLFATREAARALARQVAASGPGARLGGFVHSSNWDSQALQHLLESAAEQGLDVDLHVDEELNPAACGMAGTAQWLAGRDFAGRVVCGHTCALAAQPPEQALATLDAVARVPITLVSLPITNLLLQDGQTGRTPRLRGITLVKEARARGIPLLFASDNVQDPFCPLGSYDPLEAMAAAVTGAQLDAAFDDWSDTICRADWLGRPARDGGLRAGAAADLVIFSASQPMSWPSRSQPRVVLREGRVLAGSVPAAWTQPVPESC